MPKIDKDAKKQKSLLYKQDKKSKKKRGRSLSNMQVDESGVISEIAPTRVEEMTNSEFLAKTRQLISVIYILDKDFNVIEKEYIKK